MVAELQSAGVIGLAGGMLKECAICTNEFSAERRRAQLQCGCSRACRQCANESWQKASKKRKTATGNKKVMSCPLGCGFQIREKPTLLRVVL